MPVNRNDQLAAVVLGIDQLTTKGCDEIKDKLDALFTVAHLTLGQVNISMPGPGGPYGFTLPAAAVAGDRFGTAAPRFVVVDLLPCAYVVHLRAQVLLTDGDHILTDHWDHIAFSKA